MRTGNLWAAFCVIFVLVGSSLGSASTCEVERRSKSDNRPIGRVRELFKKSGCTLTMIGKACALSAAHCSDTFQVVEFNVPLSSEEGVENTSREWNIYPIIDHKSPFIAGAEGITDVAVVRVDKNPFTKIYPGNVQKHYDVDLEYTPKVGDQFVISGYGSNRGARNRLFAVQKETVGAVTDVRTEIEGLKSISHSAQASGGDSGAALRELESGKIIGIHTSSSCGTARAVIVGNNPKLRQLIEECLAWEKTLD